MLKEEAIDILFGCIEAHSEEENEALDMAIEALKRERTDEWCPGCKEYDMEKKCCPRFNRVIRGAMKREPSEDLISRTEAIDAMKAVSDSICEQQAVDALDAIPSADRPRPIEPTIAVDLESGVVPISACEPRGPKTIIYADRPRGEWIEETSWKYKKGGRNSDMKEILGTEWMTMIRQRCSECNKVTMVDGSILYKYCPHCGSDMRGEDDYERAIEQIEHDTLYESTYNPEDGSM